MYPGLIQDPPQLDQENIPGISADQQRKDQELAELLGRQVRRSRRIKKK